MFALATGSPAQVQLSSQFEVIDGETHDLAAPTDATVNPTAARAWVAQGRVLSAFRISDRQRMFAEDRTYSSANPPHKEKVLAAEYDNTHNWLYTLTDAGVYAEDLAVGGTPAFVDLRALITSQWSTGEYLTDLRLWPADQRAFVLTNRRIVTIQGTPASGLAIQAFTPDFVTGYATAATNVTDTQSGSASLTTLGMNRLRTLRVSVDQFTHKVMAYVTADMTLYHPVSPPPCARPFPRMLLVADLDSTTYNSPKFNAATTGGKRYVFWNPIPSTCPPSTSCNCGTFEVREYCIFDLDVYTTSARTRAYLACGRARQLVNLDLSNAWTGGVVQLGTDITVNSATDIYKVRVDPLNPQRVCAAGPNEFDMVDLTGASPVIHVSTPGVYQNGVEYDLTPLDTAIVRTTIASQTKLTAWTVSLGQVDYVARELDWTVNAAPALLGEFFTQYHCDGGVAYPPDAIYVPTFSGVARYTNSGTGGAWIATAFQSSEVPPGSGLTGATEQIDLALNATSTGDNRLIVANGLGGFDEYKLDAAKNPLAPSRVVPATSLFTNPPLNWAATDGRYGNDAAFARVNGVPFVIVDVTRTNSPTDGGLIAYRLSSSGVATPACVAHLGSTVGNTMGIHITHDIGDTHAMIVHSGGFFIVDLRGLTNATPSMSVLNAVSMPQNTWGVTTSLSRLFVCSNNASNGQVDVYNWNSTSGAITNLQTVSGIANFGGGVRARFDQHNPATGCGLLYTAQTNGYMFEFAQPANSGGFSPLATTPNFWKSDYSNQLQDCRVYDFGAGPRVLAVKDAETFALVKPTPQNCP